MATEFFKCFGAEKRQDKIVRLGENNYLLIFGYGMEEGQGYNMRKYYDHKPTQAELKADIDALVNAQIDKSILSGFSWNGKNVWLSTENQMNFKAAYDLAIQTDGATLPVKFKLGEETDGTPIYHTFSVLSEFTDFYTKAVTHVVGCLNEGWTEKDGVNYEQLLTIVVV